MSDGVFDVEALHRLMAAVASAPLRPDRLILGEVFAEDLWETMNREGFSAAVVWGDRHRLHDWHAWHAPYNAPRREDEPQGTFYDDGVE